MFQPGSYNQAAGYQNTYNANPIDESSQYPMVTCWFNVNGIDLNEGVKLRSDFTFEEVLEDARQKGIINKMPEDIKVTNKYQEDKILATLMEMQMCKLTERLGNQNDLQLVIRFTQNDFSYQPGQFQQQQQNMFQGGILKIAQPNINFPIHPQQLNQQPQANLQINNSGTLLFPNQSLQNRPVQQQQQFNNFNTTNLNTKTLNQNTQIVSNQQNYQNTSVPFTPILKNQAPTQAQQLQVNPQNSIQQQQQKTQISQIINSQPFEDQTNTIEQKVQKHLEQIIIVGQYTLIVGENGEYIIYTRHTPNMQGYFFENQGKSYINLNEKEYKWENKFGVQMAQVQEKGIIIKWKNNTYNSLLVTLY